MIIDSSQPIEEDVVVSHGSARKKMFRERSPKQTYFEQITTGEKKAFAAAPPHCRNDQGDINQKSDMIK